MLCLCSCLKERNTALSLLLQASMWLIFFSYIYSTTVRNIWEHTIFLSHRADRPICCLVWSELTTMLSVSPVMEIGSIRISTLILIYFSPLCLFMSLRSAHIFSTAHLLTFLIPAFLSPQLYSVSFFFFSFFALLLTPDLLSSVPPTLFAISTTPSIHIGLLCLPLGRHCNWLYPQGPPWSWFYQHYRRLSIEKREWPVHQKGPNSCGSEDF